MSSTGAPIDLAVANNWFESGFNGRLEAFLIDKAGTVMFNVQTDENSTVWAGWKGLGGGRQYERDRRRPGR